MYLRLPGRFVRRSGRSEDKDRRLGRTELHQTRASSLIALALSNSPVDFHGAICFFTLGPTRTRFHDLRHAFASPFRMIQRSETILQ